MRKHLPFLVSFSSLNSTILAHLQKKLQQDLEASRVLTQRC